MTPQPPECATCLAPKWGATGFSTPEGTGSLSVLALGESLGDAELADSLPFRPYAQAGGVLERAFHRLGTHREQWAVWNLLGCHPRNNWLAGAPYEHAAISHCKVHMDQVIAQYQPKCIMALGALPLRTMTGLTGQKELGLSYLRGYILEGQRYPGIPVIASYHPSYIARGKSNLLGVLDNDLRLALNVAKHGYVRPPRNYITDPNLDALLAFERECLAHPEWMIFYDIETHESWSIDESELRAVGNGRVAIIHRETVDQAPEHASDVDTVEQERPPEVTVTKIIQIQFTLRGGEGIAVPFEQPYLDVVRRVMALPNLKAAFNNWGFDDPLLREADVRQPRQAIDMMWMFHHAQPDLPRGLQYATSFWRPEFGPWKHLAGRDLAWYGCADVDNPAAWFWPLRATMEKRGIWDGYMRHVYKTNGQLELASRNGISVDVAAQQELGAEIESAQGVAWQELQALYPDELKNCAPKEGYKRDSTAERMRAKHVLAPGEQWVQRTFMTEQAVEAGMDAELYIELVEVEDEDEQGNVVKRKVRRPRRRKPAKKPKGKCQRSSSDGRGAGKSGNDSSAGHGSDSATSSAAAATLKVEVQRWCRQQPFLPGSSDQLIAYMRARKHKVPKHVKTGADTSNKEELARHAKKYKDPFYTQVVEYREYDKIVKTYIKGWTPGVDGKVHPTFTFAPATGQLSSRGPNSQNRPKRHTFADKFGRCIIATPPTHRLVNLDYRSFHVLTLGFNADSQHYMDLSRLDMHAFFTGFLLKLPGHSRWFDMLYSQPDELKAILARVKVEHAAIRNDRAKRCIAAGQLVLTNAGLVPIEQVTLEHKVWDGVAWVSHDGMVYNGKRRVITHDGLTATPDHEVFLEDGRTVHLTVASQEGAQLARTEVDGHAVQTSCRDLSASPVAKWQRTGEMPVHGMSYQEVDRPAQHGRAWTGRMPALRSTEILPPCCTAARPALRRYYCTLQQQAKSGLQTLWRTWDCLRVRVAQCIRALHDSQAATQGLRWTNHRPHRQRWKLRTRELAPCFAATASKQPPQHGICNVPGDAHSSFPVPSSFPSVLDGQVNTQGFHGRTDHSHCGTQRAVAPEALASANAGAETVRVYDIANAGPRHRFTVSGVLVHNCILGIGNGERAYGLAKRHPASFASTKDAQHVLDVLWGIFPEVLAYQDRIAERAKDEHFLTTRQGFIRWFHDVWHWQQVHETYRPRNQWTEVMRTPDGTRFVRKHGEDYESAVSWFTQNDAHCHLREAAHRLDDHRQLDERGLLTRWGFNNTVHDSLEFDCEAKLVDECVHVGTQVMEFHNPVLVSELVPDGLWCEVEAGGGENASKKSATNPDGMEDVEVTL